MPNRNKNDTVLFLTIQARYPPTRGRFEYARPWKPCGNTVPLLILRPSLIKIVSRTGNSFLTSKNANGSIFSLFFASSDDF